MYGSGIRDLGASRGLDVEMPYARRAGCMRRRFTVEATKNIRYIGSHLLSYVCMPRCMPLIILCISTCYPITYPRLTSAYPLFVAHGLQVI